MKKSRPETSFVPGHFQATDFNPFEFIAWLGRGTCETLLSHKMNGLSGFRQATPQQNRQLHILVSNSKQYVDDFAGEFTF